MAPIVFGTFQAHLLYYFYSDSQILLILVITQVIRALLFHYQQTKRVYLLALVNGNHTLWLFHLYSMIIGSHTTMNLGRKDCVATLAGKP